MELPFNFFATTFSEKLARRQSKQSMVMGRYFRWNCTTKSTIIPTAVWLRHTARVGERRSRGGCVLEVPRYPRVKRRVSWHPTSAQLNNSHRAKLSISFAPHFSIRIRTFLTLLLVHESDSCFDFGTKGKSNYCFECFALLTVNRFFFSDRSPNIFSSNFSLLLTLYDVFLRFSFLSFTTGTRVEFQPFSTMRKRLDGFSLEIFRLFPFSRLDWDRMSGLASKGLDKDSAILSTDKWHWLDVDLAILSPRKFSSRFPRSEKIFPVKFAFPLWLKIHFSS